MWCLSKFTFFVVSIWLCSCHAQETSGKKKKIVDYSEADMEKLYEQWEETDDPLPEDELPEWKRPQPKIDMSKLDPKNPEAFVQMSKKGKTLMMFVTVSDNPNQNELEQITKIWQSSLFNAHIDSQRFVIDTNRAIFMFSDGSKAWEARDFFVKQPRCLEVTIEGRSYPGEQTTKKSEF